MQKGKCRPAGTVLEVTAMSQQSKNALVSDAVCVASVERVMEVMGGKWAFPVIEALHTGSLRFSQLAKALGVSTRSLTNTLRQLEEAGIVSRTVIATVPVTVEYALTAKGRSLDPVLEAMKRWGTEWIPQDEGKNYNPIQ